MSTDKRAQGFQHRTRYLVRSSVGLLLALVLASTGCSGYGPSHPYTLDQLHIPHLQWLQALSRIPRADGTHGGVILDLTAFPRPETPTPQVILALDDTLYQSGVDGSGQRRLPVDSYCRGAAVTNGGQWMACFTSKENDDGLELVALQPTGISQEHHIALRQVSSSSALTWAPYGPHFAWSPDGQYVAAAIEAAGAPCSVAIFSSPAPHTTFTWVVNITSTQFKDEDGFCDIHALMWSHDGQQLFVLRAGLSIVMATIAVAPLLQTAAGGPPENPVSYEVPTNHIQAFAFADDYRNHELLFLNFQGDTLFFTNWGGEQLMSFNLHTKQLKTVLTLPGPYQINALTWMPDGRQLLIAVGNHPCVDCNRYAISDVYLYSLDAAAPPPPERIPAGLRTDHGT